jgi:2,5-furandicarboxylate decarboxylase 1
VVELTSAADLRGFLQVLEQRGDPVVTVDRPVSSIHELSAVVKAAEKRGNPLLRFSRVDSSDLPVLCGVYATRARIARAFGCGPEVAVEVFRERIRNVIEPEEAAEAPVKEVVEVGDEVDLNSLPIPIHGPEDAGRYITAGVLLVRHPHTGLLKAGIYRMMVAGPNRLTVAVDPWHGFGQMIEHAAAKNESLEFAVVIGAHPALAIASQGRVPVTTDILAATGALLGEPVHRTKCETVDIAVPANAEVVIEGRVLPGQRQSEGPFAEFTYYYGPGGPAPVCEVTAVTHRADAVFVDIHPTHTDHRCLLIFPGREAALLTTLQALVPGVRQVHIPLDGAAMIAAVSMAKRHDGDAQRAALAALSHDPILKHVFVFDPDVDIFDPGSMIWAMALRLRAERGLTILPNARGYDEDPFSYNLPGSPSSHGLTTKCAFDVTVSLADMPGNRADLLPEAYADLDPSDYFS